MPPYTPLQAAIYLNAILAAARGSSARMHAAALAKGVPYPTQAVFRLPAHLKVSVKRRGCVGLPALLLRALSARSHAVMLNSTFCRAALR